MGKGGGVKKSKLEQKKAATGDLKLNRGVILRKSEERKNAHEKGIAREKRE